jgi:HEAT repeat protein
LWRTGRYSPWARQKWEQEEQMADTLFEKKRKMSEVVGQASRGSTVEKNKAAEELSKLALHDPILLVRLNAVSKLGELDCQTSHEALREAGRDPEAKVRLAAVNAWRKMPSETAVPMLQKILGSDTNVDVRLEATEALGDFSGTPSIAALRMALSDSDPAILARAKQSMARVSGESFGDDLRAWRQYADHIVGSPDRTAADPSSKLK